MKYFTMLALSLFLALSSATPLSRFTSNFRDTINSIQQQTQQLPLIPNSNPETQDSGIVTLEIEAWFIFGIPVYITPIAIGNPNQVFRVVVDTGFNGLLVRSVTCDENEGVDDCGYGGELGFAYNSSASSTYVDGEERFDFMLPGHHLRGNVSVDELTLVNFELEGVKFGSVDTFYGENYFLMILADISDGYVFPPTFATVSKPCNLELNSILINHSALGLAPPNASASVPYSEHKIPNILSHLLTQAPLAKPILSFTLPDGYTSAYGSITLGALPSGHDSVETSIPFGDLSEDWNVPLNSLNLDSTTKDGKDISIDLKDFALHPTLTPGLTLPWNLTKTLYTHLHAVPDDGWIQGREFNCSYRGKLPDLTFNFPNDVNISFVEKEYTLHGWIGDKEICLLTILPHEWDAEGPVEVGTPLFDRWHVVFDLEDESMGLIERERKGEVREREVEFTEEMRVKGGARGWGL